MSPNTLFPTVKDCASFLAFWTENNFTIRPFEKDINLGVGNIQFNVRNMPWFNEAEQLTVVGGEGRRNRHDDKINVETTVIRCY
jgi:hypothetical protein